MKHLSLKDIPDISEYVKDHPEIKGSLLYQIGQTFKGDNSKFLSNPTFQKQWYVVASTDQLNADNSHKLFIQLFGQPIVIYRGSDGKLVACEDRCPHRSAALSMGIADPQKGTLQCRYHDWTFGADGKAVNIPSSSKAFRDKVQLFTIPCREHNKLVYIYHDNTKNSSSDDTKHSPEWIDDNNLIHEQLHDCYEETIADLDGVWIHHIENLLDFAHTYFIHKDRIPFQSQTYSEDCPFICQPFRDKKGFVILTSFKDDKEKRLFRFDPPNVWMVNPLDSNGAPVRIFNVGYIVPINKQHTRAVFRVYMPLWKKLRWIPMFKEINTLEGWRVFDEDNMLIAGQSTRIDLLNAPMMPHRRGDDGNIPLLYWWCGQALKKDGTDVWFSSWKCSGVKRQECNYGVSRALLNGQDERSDDIDVEDIMSTPMVISTPFGDVSATGMMKQYPPANKEMVRKMEKKVWMAKVVTATLFTGVCGSLFGYRYYNKQK